MIQEMQAEIQRLKIEVASTPRSLATPAMKDVTLDAGIKEWTGDDKGRTVREFFAQIDTWKWVNGRRLRGFYSKYKATGICNAVCARKRNTSQWCKSDKDSVKRCQPSITIVGYKMPCRKKWVLTNSQIGVGDYARKLGTVCDEATHSWRSGKTTGRRLHKWVKRYRRSTSEV